MMGFPKEQTTVRGQQAEPGASPASLGDGTKHPCKGLMGRRKEVLWVSLTVA